jgi:hypothetical protein
MPSPNALGRQGCCVFAHCAATALAASWFWARHTDGPAVTYNESRIFPAYNIISTRPPARCSVLGQNPNTPHVYAPHNNRSTNLNQVILSGGVVGCQVTLSDSRCRQQPGVAAGIRAAGVTANIIAQLTQSTLLAHRHAGGSQGWQAYEQLVCRSGGAARQSRAVDVFSYGLLLHYCLTGGRHPFGARYERDMNILQVHLVPPQGDRTFQTQPAARPWQGLANVRPFLHMS